MFKIYIHRNKLNNKIYIGQTCQELVDRWKNGEGYRSSLYFYNAIKKHGWDNFEHIVFADGLTADEANKMETLLIALYEATNPKYGYNLRSGGNNSHHSEESKLKMSAACKGKKLSEEHKKHLSEARKGANPVKAHEALYKGVNQLTKDHIFINHFNSIREAAEATGICRAGIGRSANGGCCAGGFIWKFGG